MPSSIKCLLTCAGDQPSPFALRPDLRNPLMDKALLPSSLFVVTGNFETKDGHLVPLCADTSALWSHGT